MARGARGQGDRVSAGRIESFEQLLGVRALTCRSTTAISRFDSVAAVRGKLTDKDCFKKQDAELAAYRQLSRTIRWAFLAGLVVSESQFDAHVLAEIIPLRDVFSTLFFSSLVPATPPGMLRTTWWWTWLAGGMSMTTSRTDLPQKRSRTSTQAIGVPMTTFTAVTRSDCTTVSRTAAAVCCRCRSSSALT